MVATIESKVNLFGAVAGEEPEDEDESSEGGEGHRVAGHLDGAPVLVEATDARAHQDATNQGAHSCNVTRSKISDYW